ncbi:hypothetical protein ASG49_16065 [Marmoricola sp. Leaf446]|uniref:DUF2306 domain-containing protein n=1 Tax=Marmoricola sp. Leaf446 TaxID=1736379 RepID=UPI0006F887E2|nr:DUF2306 domain-containing protein [Marmoricola sp. Leaf446]KQT89297.1 hypothetical protein ASG49_16065 [Marmoricola sp. Leaf446]
MNAGWTLLVGTHAFAATVALVLGGVQLFRPTKGDRLHRLAGRVWVVLMVYVAVTSFWIRDIRAGQLSWLHVLSTVTLVTVTLGIVHAWRGNVEAHRRNMRGSWFGLFGAGVGASAVPDRLLPQLVVTSPGGALLALLAVLATTVLVLGLARVVPEPRPVVRRPERQRAA